MGLVPRADRISRQVIGARPEGGLQETRDTSDTVEVEVEDEADGSCCLFIPLSSHQVSKIRPGSTRCATDEVEVKVEACQGYFGSSIGVLEKRLFGLVPFSG